MCTNYPKKSGNHFVMATMYNNMNVGAYWGIRKESAKSCAKRMEKMIKLFGECNPALSEWFSINSDKPLDSLDYIEEVVENGILRDDYGKVMEGGGYTFSAVSAVSGNLAPFQAHFTCGEYSGAYPNCVLIKIFKRFIDKYKLKIDDYINFARILINCWDPYYVSVYSNESLGRRHEDRLKTPFLDTILYLSEKYGQVHDLPPPSRIIRLPEGTIIITQEDMVDIKNPDHLEIVEKINRILDEHGLLKTYEEIDSLLK